MKKNKPIKSHCELGRNKEMKTIVFFMVISAFCSMTNVKAQNKSNMADADQFFPSVQYLARFYFEIGEVYLDLFRAEDVNKQENYTNAIENYQKAIQLVPQNPYYHNRLGYIFHLERRLKEASIEYAKVLELDLPQPVSAEEFELAIKYAPRIYITPHEFFGLEDVIIVIHYEKSLIEYNLFWDDDINHPEDNDPTDHEKVWIEFDPQSGLVIGVYTYFHRAVLTTKESIKDAKMHNQRARINVQWGSHGLLPLGWENIPLENFSVKYAHVKRTIPVNTMRVRYNNHKLSVKNSDHALAKSWPKKFTGSWADYIDFSKYVDINKIIKEKRMVAKSRWSNAVIDQYFLDYQFYPKFEWPDVSP